MALIPFLSVLTCSTHSPHDILTVLKTDIGHNLPVGRVKCDVAFLVGLLRGFYGGFSTWFNEVIQCKGQAPFLSQLKGLTRCQYVILKVLLKTNVQNLPLGAPNIVTFPVLTKCPVLHAILSYPFESQSLCK
jgi:hypothetical protein